MRASNFASLFASLKTFAAPTETFARRFCGQEMRVKFKKPPRLNALSPQNGIFK